MSVVSSIQVFSFKVHCLNIIQDCIFVAPLTVLIIRKASISNVPVNFKTAHPPPPRANPRAFDFFENFGQIPRHVASFDGQIPHPLELQRGSNPQPVMPCTHEINEYKQNCLPLETSCAKFSATTIFLFSLSSLHTLNKGIFHNITI